MRRRRKLSPHLKIFRSAYPALFSISKRIYGGLLVFLIYTKVVLSLYLIDLLFLDFYPTQYEAIHTKLFGVPGGAANKLTTEFTSQYLLALEEPCWIFGTVGSLHYAIDFVLIVCGCFYVTSFLVYKEDLRMLTYRDIAVPWPVFMIFMLILTCINLGLWF